MWAALIPIIAQYGLEFAMELWKRWQSGADPTEADWAALSALVSKSPEDYLKRALFKAGISLGSDEAKAILDKIPKS